MSDYIISIVIAFVALATPLALVPLLDLICPLSGHVLERSHQKGMTKKTATFRRGSALCATVLRKNGDFFGKPRCRTSEKRSFPKTFFAGTAMKEDQVANVRIILCLPNTYPRSHSSIKSLPSPAVNH